MLLQKPVRLMFFSGSEIMRMGLQLSHSIRILLAMLIMVIPRALVIAGRPESQANSKLFEIAKCKENFKTADDNDDFQEAYVAANTCFELGRRIISPADFEMALLHANLATAQLDRFAYELAIQHFEAALRIAIKNKGLNQPLVADIHGRLGLAVARKGDLKKGLQLNRKAVSILHATSASATDQTISQNVYNRMGIALQMNREYDQAIQFYELALRSAINSEQPPNSTLVIVNLNLADVWLVKENLSKGLEYAEKAHALAQKILLESNRKWASVHTTLGDVAFEQGDTDLAQDHYQKALKMKTHGLDSRHATEIAFYSNLASLLRYRGKLDESLEISNKALNIAQQTLPEGHVRLIDVYNLFVLLSHSQGKHGRAIEYCKFILKANTRTFGDLHPVVARNQHSIARAYLKNGDAAKAAAHAEQALSINLRYFGTPGIPDTWTLIILGDAYLKMRDYAKAGGSYAAAIKLGEKHFGIDHDIVSKWRENLQGAHWAEVEFEHRTFSLEK